MTAKGKSAQERKFPEGGTVRQLVDIDAAVCSYTTASGRPAFLAYQGRKSRPVVNEWAQSESARDLRMAEWIEGQQTKIRIRDADRARTNAERQQLVTALQSGSIFYVTRGYEDTSAYFYQVVGKVNARFAEVRQIESDITEHSPGAMAGYAVPKAGEFKGDTIRFSLIKLPLPMLWFEGKRVSVSWYG